MTLTYTEKHEVEWEVPDNILPSNWDKMGYTEKIEWAKRFTNKTESNDYLVSNNYEGAQFYFFD